VDRIDALARAVYQMIQVPRRWMICAASDPHLAAPDRMLVQHAGDGEWKRAVCDPTAKAARNLNRPSLPRTREVARRRLFQRNNSIRARSSDRAMARSSALLCGVFHFRSSNQPSRCTIAL